MKTLNSKPASFTDPEFEKLFNMANFANLSKEEMNMYHESQKVRWDNQNALDFAEETGMEQGIEKGIARGRAEGEHNKAIDMGLKMLASNEPLDKIIDYTGLSLKEIQSLQK
jgi:predicted transposase/invertase (TIGR01784 family)